MSYMRELLGTPSSSSSSDTPSTTASTTIPPSSSSQPPSVRKQQRHAAGMSREVYRLCGDGLVSLPTSFTPSTPSSSAMSPSTDNRRTGKVGTWRMVCFTNSAAANKKLKLRHWSKSAHLIKLPTSSTSPASSTSSSSSSTSSFSSSSSFSPPSAITPPFFSSPPQPTIPCDHLDTKDYSFSAFSSGTNNISPTRCISTRVLNYTPDLYSKYIAPTDHTWSKAETDILFDLCNMFDLRFFVVFDRYPKQFKRSIEALKHRYYSIARILAELRYEARISAELAKVQNHAPTTTTTNATAAGDATAVSAALYTQTMAVVNRLRDERSRDPVLKFVYSPTADVDRKQHVHKIMTKTTAHKLSEKQQVVESIKQQTVPQPHQQQQQHHKQKSGVAGGGGGGGSNHHTNVASRHTTPPSVHLSSAVIERAKSAGERQRAELIDSTLDEKVALSSSASLRLVAYPYASSPPSSSAPSPSHQQPTATATASCPAVGGGSKLLADTTGTPVASSAWLQPYHIFTLHTSTYFPPNSQPPNLLPSTQQPSPPATPAPSLPGSTISATTVSGGGAVNPPTLPSTTTTTTTVGGGGGSSISPLPSATPDLISSFSRVRTGLCSTLIASLRLDIALSLSLGDKVAALKKELQHWQTMAEKHQQEPREAIAKQQQAAGGEGKVVAGVVVDKRDDGSE
eukprot:GHVS01089455.1.p1 GENE.GHVS01089455.1~~GHVS01089455.1.p1  ORF type:complete len:715 (-),score=294.67 GHVS01089455.1:613-2661(-)